MSSSTSCNLKILLIFNLILRIQGIVNKATRMIGLVYRSFTYIDIKMFLMLYKTLIRPILEFGNTIWHPLFKKQSITVENVQRRATRMLPDFEFLSYEERLRKLSLPSLKYRRLRGDLIHLYKIVHGLINIDHRKLFDYSPITFTRGDRYKIFIIRCNSQIRQNSFIARTVKAWNNLRYSTKDSDTVNSFKNNVDKELCALTYEFDE